VQRMEVHPLAPSICSSRITVTRRCMSLIRPDGVADPGVSDSTSCRTKEKGCAPGLLKPPQISALVGRHDDQPDAAFAVFDEQVVAVQARILSC
jgi:hypothetical protein